MKIGLAGTMSVGKTTLAKALGELDQFKDHSMDHFRKGHIGFLRVFLLLCSILDL